MQQRTAFFAFNVYLLALVVIALSACTPGGSADNPSSSASALPGPSQTQERDNDSLALAERLKSLCQPAGGIVGIAVTVLVSGSKLPEEAQENLIAEAARMVYDAYVSTPAAATK